MDDRCTIEDAPEASFLDGSNAALNLSSIHPAGNPPQDLGVNFHEFKNRCSAELEYFRQELAAYKISHAALRDRCQAIEAENRVLREKVFTLQSRNAVQLTQITAEMEDKECRKRNIILAGLPEIRNRNARSRGSDDKAAILRTLTTIRPETTIDDLQHVTRLGGKTQNRSRPVKVVLRSPETAKDVLEKARRKHVPGIKLLYDRTPAEQEVLDALRKELEERRLTDNSLTIRFIRGVPKIVRKRQGNARRQH